MTAHTREPVSPGDVLTVVIRDDAPLIHANDAPRYRSVRIALTPKQQKALALRWTDSSGGHDHYEEVSRCFIESRSDLAALEEPQS